MKSRMISATLFLLMLSSVGAIAPVSRSQAANPRNPVLVELFTSEGCSSCPPADSLLAKINSLQPFANAEVIILEQHVDYWDGQGWLDPFASSAATRRQEEYSRILGSEVYTPQMVVDGHLEFVGGNGIRAKQAIETAAADPKAQLQLAWAGDAAGDSRALRIQAGKLPGDASDKFDVLLAVTESHLHSNVRAGENAGRGLEHDGVVRAFTKVGKANAGGETSFETQITVKLGKEWKRDNLRAVVFIQSTRNRHVLAASAIPF
ncbi:MAG TPA: DUF1223 domain-containing protein [Candidatus Acidoferrales bacterium]|nr:DUF1223 domain-containing protein [Candidatus Acidoferrales bacterium]